jgi:hypothetical protein
MMHETNLNKTLWLCPYRWHELNNVCDDECNPFISHPTPDNATDVSTGMRASIEHVSKKISKIAWNRKVLVKSKEIRSQISTILWLIGTQKPGKIHPPLFREVTQVRIVDWEIYGTIARCAFLLKIWYFSPEMYEGGWVTIVEVEKRCAQWRQPAGYLN